MGLEKKGGEKKADMNLNGVCGLSSFGLIQIQYDAVSMQTTFYKHSMYLFITILRAALFVVSVLTIKFSFKPA